MPLMPIEPIAAEADAQVAPATQAALLGAALEARRQAQL